MTNAVQDYRLSPGDEGYREEVNDAVAYVQEMVCIRNCTMLQSTIFCGLLMTCPLYK